MRTKTLVASLVIMTVCAVSPAFGADMFSGTWKMNVAKSNLGSATSPKDPPIQKITASKNGLTLVADSVSTTGQKARSQETTKFDGKDYPVTVTLDGKPNPAAAGETVSVKKIDDYTFEFTFKVKGKVTVVAKNVVSKDGKTRTATRTGTNAQGQPINQTYVWEKQ